MASSLATCSKDGRPTVRITKVQLENIKSYRHISVPLTGGTTAIRGHNGAGKSTLVEAIGFALFDALNYDQAQFIREGERYGTVTISFISALDDREYQAVRRCGSSAVWYIYDPDIQARVVEQKTDVTDFLRKHLRLESDIALKDLFNDALGVPQGTFTADFLLTPTHRKKKFDTLLQVEDYRRAAEKLNDTRSYLQDERRAIETRIADLERETGQLDSWRDRLIEHHDREQALVLRLAEVQQLAREAEAQRDALRRQQEEVTRLEGAARIADAAAQSAAARLRDTLSQVEESRAAVRICEESRADYTAHLSAQEQFGQANQRARDRDTLLRQRATAAQQLEGVQRDRQHARAQLESAREAEQRIVALVPALQRQAELERAREDARHAVQQLEEWQRQRVRIEQEIARLDAEIAEGERLVAQIESLRPLAGELEERRTRVSVLQDIRARRTERESRLKSLADELAKNSQLRDKAAKAAAKAHDNVQKLLDSQPVAEQAPAREAAHTEAQRVVQDLEARRKHHQLSREQSGAGLCPFLREPCQNIRQRGENSLATYFDRLIEEDESELIPARSRLTEAAAELDHARKVAQYVDQLPLYQEKQRETAERLNELDEQHARLTAERDELDSWLAAASTEDDLVTAQTFFKESDDADKRLRELAPRQAELARSRERRDALSQEAQTLHVQLRDVATVPDTLQSIDSDLQMLGDPRAESAALERVARERPQHEASLATHEAAATQLQTQCAALDESLRPFATLDDDLRILHETIDRTREGHNRHLQHQQSAQRLPERESAVREAQRVAQAATQECDRAKAAHESARSTFDPAELQRVNQRVDELGAERGRATEELRHTQEQSAHLQHEIARVEALLDDLRAARDERDSLKGAEEMLQQFRDTIKEAGPNIMKALLRQISVEANRIFGEIMGDRSPQLSWEADYEIVLRRDGKERTFAQLSGGEQMSAALAVRLALLRSLTRLDIAFFDEPTQNMDDERRGNLAEQIRRVRGFDQLIVISHDDTFEQGLDSVIHLEKRNGETLLMEEDALVSA